MQVKEIMSPKPVYISPETPLVEAARKMRDLDCGFLPIGKDDRLQGIVTDRDITVRCVAEGKDPAKTTADQAMTEKVLYCFENQDVDEAAESMEKQQIRRLIVLNNEDDKWMTGVISLGDIATRSDNTKLSGEITEKVSEKAA